MKSVSEFIKKSDRFQELSSPYLECKVNTNDETFNKSYKKFIVELAREDASYKGEESNVNVYKKLDQVIESIHNEEIFRIFKTKMKELSKMGEFSKLVYDNYNIKNMAITNNPEFKIFIENNPKFHDLKNRIYYTLNKVERLLVKNFFTDYVVLLRELTNLKIELSEYKESDDVDISKVNSLNERIQINIDKVNSKIYEQAQTKIYNNIVLELAQ